MNSLDQLKSETDPFAKAKLIRSLIRDGSWRLKDIARELSFKPAYLCHYLRLNRLPEIAVDGFYSKNISLSHLFVISRLKNESQIISAYEKVLEKSLTVAQTEELIREIIHQVKTEGEGLTEEEKTGYKQKLGADINLQIIQTRIKSKLVIEVKGSLMKSTKAIRTLLDKLAL